MTHTLTPLQGDQLIKEKPDQQNESSCTRCGGMLVRDWCENILNSGMLKIPIQRCIQCGDIIDSVILQHRDISQHSTDHEQYCEIRGKHTTHEN
ncbi:hypothetical protein [Nitrospira sp. M1]